MESVFQSLLILMVVIWSVAVVLRRLGIPTIMGELLLGVILGPAVLGWIQPSEIIDTLAMLAKLSRHAGLTRASEALDDALILVFDGLCADTRGRSRCKIERFNDASCQGTAALIETERNLAGDVVLSTRR